MECMIEWGDSDKVDGIRYLTSSAEFTSIAFVLSSSSETLSSGVLVSLELVVAKSQCCLSALVSV